MKSINKARSRMLKPFQENKPSLLAPAELLYLMNTYICDNDMCEQEFDITGPDVKVETIANRTYSFCCEHCCSYGSWSIRYDLRKHYRKMSG